MAISNRGIFSKDLDRYLMELLVDGRKPPELHKVAADLIAGLLQSSISGWSWIPGRSWQLKFGPPMELV